MSKRRQINFRTDDEIIKAIDDVRRVAAPIPTMSEVLRQAVLEYREKVLRKIEAQKVKK